MAIRLPYHREIGNSENPYKARMDKRRREANERKNGNLGEQWKWRGEKGNKSGRKSKEGKH